jgi:hypothetical protein
MTKQKLLVTQHLENLSREVLKDYKYIIREYVCADTVSMLFIEKTASITLVLHPTFAHG